MPYNCTNNVHNNIPELFTRINNIPIHDRLGLMKIIMKQTLEICRLKWPRVHTKQAEFENKDASMLSVCTAPERLENVTFTANFACAWVKPYPNFIVFEKLGLQHVFRPRRKANSLGLKSVLEKLHCRNGSVWTEILTGKIKFSAIV